MKSAFKVGDLVKMDNKFCSTRHPPIGTYGIVIDVENWHGQFADSNSDSDEMIDVEQFVNVHWAHHLNSDEQCYCEVSLKKVSEV